MNRRRFMQSVGAAFVASRVPVRRESAAAWSSTVKPQRLKPGDTVARVSPANAAFNPLAHTVAPVNPANAPLTTLELQVPTESLDALGFKVRQSAHMLERHGYLAGEDKARAEDINTAFADGAVACVHAIRGGWGSARLLPHL